MDDGVGNKLREARTRRRIDLEEIEQATKIRARYLLAIENEDWDHLPGDTYARAFIRTYGSLLGLDGDRLAEEQRRQRGAAKPGEALPRVDPRPHPVARRRSPRRRINPRLLGAAVSALVVAALLVLGLATGEEGDEAGSGPDSGGGPVQAVAPGTEAESDQPNSRGHTFALTATGEVWVCLLDAGGTPLVDGAILAAGEAVGPFRSGSFTLALGNGAMTMTVDGKQQDLPEPSSPIGFTIGRDGLVRELPEGERPTCT